MENLPANKEEKVEIITEGKATVRLRNDKFCAFYNPAQGFNRDLSVAVIRLYQETLFPKLKRTSDKFNVVDALSATGLRAFRYLAELDSETLGQVAANDMDSNALELIEENAVTNKADSNHYTATCFNSNVLLMQRLNFFHCVDLDPYGSAMNIVDCALQSIVNGGLLCVTFTDMAVLCGNYAETCLYKYGSVPYKSSSCHEMAKRIALRSISSCANKYKRVIRPLVSINADFYIRMFVTVHDSAEDCKNVVEQYGYVFHCRQCQFAETVNVGSFEQKGNGKKFKQGELVRSSNKCPLCNGNLMMAGPYWTDKMQDFDFVNNLIERLAEKDMAYMKYGDRVSTFLKAILEESRYDQVLSYDYPRFCKETGIISPKIELIR